jgi:hypothetical protein
MTCPLWSTQSLKRSEVPVPQRKSSLPRSKRVGHFKMPHGAREAVRKRRERAARRPPDAALGDVSRPPDTIEALRARLIDAPQRQGSSRHGALGATRGIARRSRRSALSSTRAATSKPTSCPDRARPAAPAQEVGCPVAAAMIRGYRLSIRGIFASLGCATGLRGPGGIRFLPARLSIQIPWREHPTQFPRFDELRPTRAHADAIREGQPGFRAGPFSYIVTEPRGVRALVAFLRSTGFGRSGMAESPSAFPAGHLCSVVRCSLLQYSTYPQARSERSALMRRTGPARTRCATRRASRCSGSAVRSGTSEGRYQRQWPSGVQRLCRPYTRSQKVFF